MQGQRSGMRLALAEGEWWSDGGGNQGVVVRCAAGGRGGDAEKGGVRFYAARVSGSEQFFFC